MNRLLLVLLIFIVILCVYYNVNGAKTRSKKGRKGKCRGRNCNRQCTPFDRYTTICCKRYGKRCCKASELHDKPSCDGGSVSYHMHPCYCQLFYMCDGTNMTRHRCPIRGAWDNGTQSCKEILGRRSPAFCQGRKYYYKRIPGYFIDVTLTVEKEGTSSVSFTEKAPANDLYNVLLYLQQERNDFVFTTQFSAIFWHTVNCINGDCADSNNYWSLQINGRNTTLGVSSILAYRPMNVTFVYKAKP